MEITNDIKAKVFAQYSEENIEYTKEIGRKYYFTKIDFEKGYLSENNGCTFDISEVKLILKPLSAMLREDAIEVAKLQQEKFGEGLKISLHIDDKNYGCLDCLIEWDGHRHDYWQPVYSPTLQYLQSKGYDLPQYLLGGKTLHEAGLAIYEEETNEK
jgi:hypothetical protein